jgi:hypothetical protein
MILSTIIVNAQVDIRHLELKSHRILLKCIFVFLSKSTNDILVYALPSTIGEPKFPMACKHAHLATSVFILINFEGY